MIRHLALLTVALALVACGGQRAAEPEPATTIGPTATADRGFEHRFNAIKVRESKLLPQLTAPGELSPATRTQLQREAGEILDDLRALAAEDLARAQRRKVETEITNLENMVAMYLPAG